MPSVSKKQAHLFAMAYHNHAFAKKQGISRKVAGEFHSADKRTGILRKASGGSTPLQAGMDGQQNFGQGRGHSMFSKMPLMGHAMSGTQLGQADALIRKSQMKFAEGGSVKKGTSAKPAKPQMSAKERREIRALIEKGKANAVASLRGTRTMLLETAPRAADDPEAALASLRRRLAAKEDDDPTRSLLAELGSDDLDPQRMMQIVDQLAAREET